MSCYVTDASFLIKCIVPEEHSSTVIAFALKGHELIVPDLFYPETANILWKKARCGEMQKDENTFIPLIRCTRGYRNFRIYGKYSGLAD